MKIELEEELLDRMIAGERPYHIICDMVGRGALPNGKQAYATLDKWGTFLDCGTSLSGAWFRWKDGSQAESVAGIRARLERRRQCEKIAALLPVNPAVER